MQDHGKLNNIFFNALVDGCTGAALFSRLRWLGAPTMIDTRTVPEYLASLDRQFDRHQADILRAVRSFGPGTTKTERVPIHPEPKQSKVS
jgi:hypothetical protein